MSQFNSKSDEQNDVNAWRNLSKSIEEKLKMIPFNVIMESDDYSLFGIKGHISSSPVFITGMSSIGTLDIENSSENFTQNSVQPYYQKISSTEYSVNVKANGPFYVVLAQSYDDGWNAFVNGYGQIPAKNHFIAEGFANGWYLDKTGNLNIKLYFQPQEYYNFGLVVYASVICSCFFYFFFGERKKVKDYILRMYRSRIAKT